MEHAYKIGRFVGWYYGARQAKKARVILGKDTRRSSYMFESALVSGLVASGADAYMLHVIPTPGVFFEVVDGAFDCGVTITASHNPYTDNGIKLVNREGYKMDEDVLELIEDYIDGKTEVPLATGDAIGCTVDYMQGRNRYISHLIASCGFSLQGLKIGLDCANGSASSVARPVFDALGAETHVINNAPNGFNINVDCGSTHIDQLQRFVVQNGLDVGFAYDGDADRCLAVDERGHVVDGDLILYVCGCYMAKHGRLAKQTVVPTVMSNFGFFRASTLPAFGEKTAVGDKNVYACMRQNGYTLGGEQSGHIIFGDLEKTGDGIMTSLRWHGGPGAPSARSSPSSPAPSRSTRSSSTTFASPTRTPPCSPPRSRPPWRRPRSTSRATAACSCAPPAPSPWSASWPRLPTSVSAPTPTPSSSRPSPPSRPS